MRWLSILVLALALVAAGCGGGDDESSASDETTVEETLTDTTTDETTTEDTATDTDADFDFADEDCQALLGVGASIAAAFAGAGGKYGCGHGRAGRAGEQGARRDQGGRPDSRPGASPSTPTCSRTSASRPGRRRAPNSSRSFRQRLASLDQDDSPPRRSASRRGPRRTASRSRSRCRRGRNVRAPA